MKLSKGTILTDNDILSIAIAGHNKIESEIYVTKHISPTNTLNLLLTMFGFDSLYQFTSFLKGKYDIDIQVEDMFILNPTMVYVVKADKRETMLAFYKQIIREIKLNQVID